MIEKHLMTWEEYEKTFHPTPYSFVVSKAGRCIYYFGARHSCDPKDPQFPLIKKFWKEFLKTTEGKDRMVFVEGGVRPMSRSANEAIARGGEPDFITYAATKEGIKIISPEPPESLRYKELLKHFTKEEIAYHDFARMVYQWNRRIKKPDFAKYLGDSLAWDRHQSGWVDFDFSIAHMIAIHEKLFKRAFDKDDKDLFAGIVDPTKNLSRINAVSHEVFRDAYILRQIEKYWKKGTNLFIVYGSSHAVMQERAIRALGQQKQKKTSGRTLRARRGEH